MSRNKILITGAAGRIGQRLLERFHDQYDFVLTDKRLPQLTYGFPFQQAEISDFAALRPLFEGVHTVIHLAANAWVKASWEDLLPSNIVGTYNVFQAAAEAACKRVIFASSVNAVAAYPAEVQVKEMMPVNPPNLYGASKAWGEAVGRFYADFKGLSVYCLRLGWVVEKDSEWLKPDHPLLDIVLTYGDMLKLFEACLEAPLELRFGLFHGLSDNRFKRLDISEARRLLGYAPEDDSYVLAGVVAPGRPDHLFENK
jgi:uronate dehydrogenase